MSYHDPIRGPRHHWSKAGERVRARRPSGRRRKGSPASWAELRLVVLLGLFISLAYDNRETPVSWPRTETTGAPAPVSARFGLCHSGGGWNCVVDGDTFYAEGVKIRIADIDAPETHPPRCPEEARLGEAATLRMRALLSEGPFTMAAADRDEDRYGRKLRVVVRNGESLGGVLVVEGLARPYAGGRQVWC